MDTEVAETRIRKALAPVNQVGRGVREMGRSMWLAGLGAIDTVDQRSRGAFTDLVGRGRKLEQREQPIFGARIRRVGERVDALRDRVEQEVESTLGGTLQRLGVPDRDEVHQLIDRIEKLTQEVEGLKTRTAS
ncbi:MAG: phasin family protein [Acidobacteriota bacterium]